MNKYEGIEEFRMRLRRRATAIQAAQLSLNQRVREFVSKTDRADAQPIHFALDELDRVSRPTRGEP